MQNPGTMVETGGASAAAELLRYARSLGVEFIFTNLGSDHPAFIQAFAALDPAADMPEIISCPHEMTALSAAHGYAMITRRPQMVLVHVDVGTQNLGGSIHNIARARVPAIIIAGLSPLTLSGDRPGTRTEFIHYTQDAPSQIEIVRQYMKWTYELRAPETVRHVLLRGHQIASTLPEGPVYITGAREIWEEAVNAPPLKVSPPARLGGLPPEAVSHMAQRLAQARRPLVITSSLGRSANAVERLVQLSERQDLAVQEASPQYMNFPGDHPNHVGYRRDTLLDKADFILILESTVPWLPQFIEPSPDADVFHVDSTPLKEDIGLWSYPIDGSYRADVPLALAQLLDQADAPAAGISEERRRWIQDCRDSVTPPPDPTGDAITPLLVSRTLSRFVDDDSIVVVETPTSTPTIPPNLRMRRPLSYFSCGGSGLGWGINAAIGARLACPDKTVIALVGDGSYIFGVPTSTYWVASHYETPFLTIIYNNSGWRAPKHSNDLVHARGGLAGSRDTYFNTVGRDARLADVAAAAGQVAAFRVSDPDALAGVLEEAFETVRGGRSAVVDVVMEPVSGQRLGRRKQ